MWHGAARSQGGRDAPPTLQPLTSSREASPGLGRPHPRHRSHPCVPPPPQGKRKADSLGGRGRRSQLAGLVLVKKAKMDSAGQVAPSPGECDAASGRERAAACRLGPVWEEQ